MALLLTHGSALQFVSSASNGETKNKQIPTKTETVLNSPSVVTVTMYETLFVTHWSSLANFYMGNS